MKTHWPTAESYLNTLESKEEKWAFSFTPSSFVAGVASTQRQELMNFQVKASLLSNSSLDRIIDGFFSVDKSTATKIIQATLDSKLYSSSPDPIMKKL